MNAATYFIIILGLFVLFSTIIQYTSKNNFISVFLNKKIQHTNSEDFIKFESHSELSLYTYAEPPVSFPVFTDVSLQSRSVQFLSHSFKGKYIYASDDYFGFSLPVSNTTGHLDPSLLVYVIVPLTTPTTDITKKEVQLKLKSVLKNQTQSDLHLLFPIFDLSMNYIGSGVAASFTLSTAYKTSMQLKSSKLSTSIPLQVNRPFYLYLIETNTNTILGDAFMTHLGPLILNPPSIESNTVATFSSDSPKQEAKDQDDPSPLTQTSKSSSYTESLVQVDKQAQPGNAEFHPIQYLSKHLSEKSIPFEASLSPLGVSYSYLGALSLMNTSSSIGKAILNYVFPKFFNQPNVTTSIHQMTKALTPNVDDYGYFFYSPTFTSISPLSVFNESVIERSTDFQDLQDLKVGHHELPLNFMHFYPLDPTAHTLVHYLNLDQWYWSTPFIREPIPIHYWGLRQSMYTFAHTAFVMDEASHFYDRYKAFKLDLQNHPLEHPRPMVQTQEHQSENASSLQDQTKLSVYIVFNFFNPDDHDTPPRLSNDQFTRIRLDLLQATPRFYKIRMAMFQPHIYQHTFSSHELPRLFALREKGFPELEKNETVEMTLEQTINLCVTEKGLGISSDFLAFNENSNLNHENEKVEEIQVLSPFYFILFDESTESMVSATFITRKQFAVHPVECV